MRAVGLTVYYVAQYLVLQYVRKTSHIGPLWFANVANNILWWTFVKAAYRSANSMSGKTLTFKSTLKGKGMMAARNLGDLWMPAVCLLALLVSLGARAPLCTRNRLHPGGVVWHRMGDIADGAFGIISTRLHE